MGKRFFIPFHPEHSRELGSNKAELLYEYLKFCQGDDDGVTKSVTQIERDLDIKRTAQINARKLLAEKGWLSYVQVTKKSPTLRFKIELTGKEKYERARAKFIKSKFDRTRRR